MYYMNRNHQGKSIHWVWRVGDKDPWSFQLQQLGLETRESWYFTAKSLGRQWSIPIPKGRVVKISQQIWPAFLWHMSVPPCFAPMFCSIFRGRPIQESTSESDSTGIDDPWKTPSVFIFSVLQLGLGFEMEQDTDHFSLGFVRPPWLD